MSNDKDDKDSIPEIVIHFEKTEVIDLGAVNGDASPSKEKKVVPEGGLAPSENKPSNGPIVLSLDKTDVITSVPSKEFREAKEELTPLKPVKEKKLVLEQPARAYQAPVRTKPAAEAAKSKKKIEYAPIYKRAIAQIIDLAVIAIVFVLSAFLVPLIDREWRNLLDRMHLKSIYGASTTTSFFHFALFTIDIFIIFAVFLSYTNTSIGKKTMKLQVRGKDQYAVTVAQAFLREMVFKPISYLTVLGILWAFVNSEKKALHDYLSATIVVIADE